MLITVKEAAEMTGLHPRTIRKYMAEGKLTPWKADPTSAKSAVRLQRAQVEQLFRPVVEVEQ